MEHHPESRNYTVLGKHFFVAAIVMFFAVSEVSGKFTPNARAVALEHVPHLTFQKWELTNYRRNEPMYQLKCLAGCEFEPDWVKCHNVPAVATGSRGPSWQCETDLPLHLQFSTLEVVCEGYASRNDEFILEGSCGLEYSLKLVPLPFPNLESVKGRSGVLSHLELEAQWRWFHWLVLGSVIYVCCYCLYHVVQDDLHEALTKECTLSAVSEKKSMAKSGETCNVTGSEREMEMHQGKAQRQEGTPKARQRVFCTTALESFDMEVRENENFPSQQRNFTPFLEMKGKLSLDLFQTN